MAQTLFDKIWNDHIVSRSSSLLAMLYIDIHLINKVTSPGAFDVLRKRDLDVFRPKQTVILHEPGYKVPIPLSDLGRFQSDLLFKNCSDFGIEVNTPNANFDSNLMASPGQIIVCDPDKTNNIGAFGVIAIGIKETQISQVLQTQCLLMQKPKTMKIEINGKLRRGLGVKDINQYLIYEISSIGAKGYFIEFGGDTILSLDMDGRIAICNMSREIGAEGGIIAPDGLTFDYLKERGIASDTELDDEFPVSWKTLFSDETSVFDEVLEFDAEDIRPGTYGVSVSKLLSSESLKEPQVSDDRAGIIEEYISTDYILSQKDSIEDFERTQAYTTFNGVNPF